MFKKKGLWYFLFPKYRRDELRATLFAGSRTISPVIFPFVASRQIDFLFHSFPQPFAVGYQFLPVELFPVHHSEIGLNSGADLSSGIPVCTK